MTRTQIEAFARDWTDAWSDRDVERVLAWFADDVRFTSPLAAEVLGHSHVEGKQALREYWTAAVARRAGVAMRFTLDRVVWDPETRECVIVYTAEVGGRLRKACEFLTFNDDGLVVHGEAMHGAEV